MPCLAAAGPLLRCLALFVALVGACAPVGGRGDEDSGPSNNGDGGDADAGSADAGREDNDEDAGREDAGREDAGREDAGETATADAGPTCSISTLAALSATMRCCNGDDEARPICVGLEAVGCPDGFNQHAAVDGFQRCGVSTNTPETGVPCAAAGVLACAPGQWCWETVATTCQDAPQEPFYALRECDGPEDCAGGLCCVRIDVPGTATEPTRFEASCAAACAADETRHCNTDGDCPDGERCCQSARRSASCAAACQE